MTATDLYGPSTGIWTVEQATISLLSTPPRGSTFPLIAYHLADQERSLGLDAQTLPLPPGPESYRGGVDALTLMAEWFPMLHVNVRPGASAQRLDPRTYQQSWNVTITATDGDDDENIARRNAYCYSAAVAQLIAQHGSLGIGATNTTLTRIGTPELLDSVSARQVCRTSVEFSTLTVPVATVGGPTSFPPDPYQQPGSWPTVQTVGVTVDAVAPTT